MLKAKPQEGSALKSRRGSGKAKQIILSLAIAILFVLFIAYAIETAYPSPKYENYCPTTPQNYINQTECEANNGTWINYGPEISAKPSADVTGYCDTYTKCQRPWESVREKYNRNVFFISLIIGILTVVISIVLSVESVSSGLMGGGAILMIYGTIRYWGSLSDIFRTIMIGIALAVLIWIGYKKLK